MQLLRKTRRNYQLRAIPDCSTIMQYADAYGYLEYRKQAGIQALFMTYFRMGHPDNNWSVRFCVLHENMLYIYSSPNGKSPDEQNHCINLKTCKQFSTNVYPSGSLKLSKAVLTITNKKSGRHQFCCSPSFNCSHVWFDIFKKALELSAVKPKPFDNLVGRKLSHKGCRHQSVSPCSKSIQGQCPLRICPTGLGMQRDTRKAPWSVKDEEEICMTLLQISRGINIPDPDKNDEDDENALNGILLNKHTSEIASIKIDETLFSADSSFGRDRSQTQHCRQSLPEHVQEHIGSPGNSVIIAEKVEHDVQRELLNESPFLKELRAAVAIRRARLEETNILEELDDSVRDKQMSWVTSECDVPFMESKSNWSNSIANDLKLLLLDRRLLVAGDSPSETTDDDDTWTQEWE